MRGDDLSGRVQRLRARRRRVARPAAAAPPPQAAQPSCPKARPAGRLSADQRTARRCRGPIRARPLGGRPDRRASQRRRRGDLGGAHQPARLGGAAARRLPRTLTWDQGRELARRADIEAALGIDVYFCDPHSPWQRGSNEQTNGLLRRWLPKGTPLDISPLHLSVIEDNLNHMPRRLHNWTSAAHTYTRLSRNHR